MPLLATVLLSSCQPQDTVSDSQFQSLRRMRLDSFQACPRGEGNQQASLLAQSLCTRFQVPENPADANSRQIELKVLIIPSQSIEPEADPLVFLAGGPGQAATELLQVAQIFAEVRRKRDIVLLDQRGTGELSPLKCELEQTNPLDLGIELDEMMLIQQTQLRDCLAQLDARPEYYTTDIAIQDLEAFREYMGYSGYNLVGGSYGSRVALAYLRAYPEVSRSVIIDGIAPPAISLPLYITRDASNALENIFIDCSDDLNCDSAYPSLRQHFDELLNRLQTPAVFSVYDTLAHRDVEVTLNRDMFLALLRQPLYTRETQRLIPWIIERAWQGDYTPLTAALVMSDMQLSQTMFLSVICNEDMRLISREALNREAASNYLMNSSLLTVPMIEACELWPQRELPDTYFEPVSADRPVLILSGALDPVTPPLWGELVKGELPDSLHLVVAGYAHGTMAAPCILGLMTDFIETANLQNLDTSCVDNYRRRPFFTTAGGSVSTDD